MASAATQATDGNALARIESRQQSLQEVPVGALPHADAQATAARDIVDLKSIRDEGTRASAAVAIGENADRHPHYASALRAADPGIAVAAQAAFERDRQIGAAKDLRKAFDTGRDEDAGGKRIALRYETLWRAGLGLRDLAESHVGRLATQDHTDLAMLRGGPTPHSRLADVEALVNEQLQHDGYRNAFKQAGRESEPRSAPAAAKTTAPSLDGSREAEARETPPSNTMRSGGHTTAKRAAVPPLEDRFNIKAGLLETEYRFRDRGGKVAFTEKMFSLHTSMDGAAAIKAMVDRAAERGWQTVSLKGSPEFVRQSWIASSARGLKAVGHTPTEADRDAANKERDRLSPDRSDDGRRLMQQVVSGAQVERTKLAERARSAPGSNAQRQLAATIERALVDAKVSPEVVGQVRALMAAEGARRMARGEKFKVPVYDAQAARARPRTVDAGPQRASDRERSR